METSAPKQSVRRPTGLTFALEKRALIAIATRLPPWVTPNRLTAIGLLGGFMTGAGYALSGQSRAFLWIAILGYVVHWFGDSLDGTTARVRGVERPRFGMFIDQSADLATVFMILGGLGLSPWARFDLALAAYAGYLLIAVLVHLRAGVTGVYDIAHDGVGPTEGRLMLIALTLSMVFVGPGPVVSWGGGLSQIELFLIAMTLWSVATFAREVIRVGRQLAREEPNRSRRA